MSSVWPILHFDDTASAVAYLVDVFGFGEVLVARDEDGEIVHAELDWPGGGSLVLGSTKHADGVHGAMEPGTAASYVVTADVDDIHERVRRAGLGTVVRPPASTHFGSGAQVYAFTASDPEGNLWTFGTYEGADAARGR